MLFDTEADPDETTNVAGDPANAERCRTMNEWLHRGFSWDEVHTTLARHREELPKYLSGHMPGTPNQYMLPDGRVFDAEKSLYDARWLMIPEGATSIIPQQFG